MNTEDAIDMSRLRHLLDTSEDAAMLVDCETRRYALINQAAAQLLGCRPGDPIARDAVRGEPPILADHRTLIERFPQAIASDIVLDHRDGTPVAVTATRQALRIAGRWQILVTARSVAGRAATPQRLEHYKMALDEASDAVLLLDPQRLAYVEVNEAAARMFGMSRADIIALGPVGLRKMAIEVAPGEDVEPFLRQRYAEAIARAPAAATAQTALRRRDGSIVTMEAMRRAFRSGDGWLIVVVMRDITERIAAQFRLELFQAAMDNSMDALVIVDHSSMRFVAVNQTAMRLAGLTYEQYLAQDPRQRARQLSVVQDLDTEYGELIAISPNPRVTVESRETDDGSKFPAEVVRVALEIQGRWIIVINVHDISERQASLRRLELLKAAMDNASDAIVIIDPQALRYLDFNVAAQRIIGLSPEQMMDLGPAACFNGTGVARQADELRESYANVIAMHPRASTEMWERPAQGDRPRTIFESIRHAVRMDGQWLIASMTRDITERMADQRRLKQLEAAIDQAADQILVIDPETMSYLHINKMTEQMLGMTREEMMQAGVSRVVAARAPASAAHTRQIYRDLIASYPATGTVLRQVTHTDGTIVDVETTRRAVQVDGKWLIVSVSRDITERKAVERRLEQLRLAVNEAADGIQVIDPQTMTFEDVNEAAARIFGMSRVRMLEMGPVAVSETMGLASAESLAARFEEVIARHPDAVSGMREFSLQGGAPQTLEFTRRAVRADDRWLIVSIERDVTERVTEQRHLKRLLAAINEAPDAVMIADPKLLHNVEVNEATEQIYGLTRDELLGVPLYEIPYGFGMNSAEDLAAAYRQIIAQQPEPVRRVREFRGKGRPVAMVESTRRAVQVDGQWLIVGVMRDVTERVRAERELEQRMEELARSNRDLEQFAYVTSHDLSEPLRMVASYTQLLARRYGTHFDDDGREFMGYVVTGAQRMKQLIDDLLVYSRAGRADTQFKQVCLDKPLDEAIANLKHAIRDSDARIERPAAMPTLPGDKTGLAQLFQNLLANAIKFKSEAPVSIRIGAAQEGGDWIFSVTDNGIGIEPQYFERIFVIFQRLHARSSYEGTGIGLAICKKIVERHSGSIWVEPAEGGGTSFKVRLPGTQAQSALSSPSP